MTPFEDARACGRFTRSLAVETFRYRDLMPWRDHDAIIALWAELPGFMDGYLEDCS